MASSLLTMLRDSVAEPRLTADRLLAMRPPIAVVVQAAVLMSVLDALTAGLLGGGFVVLPAIEGELLVSPFQYAGLLLASLLAGAMSLQVSGRMLGGKGHFREALLLFVWLDVLLFAIQAVSLLVALVLPPFIGLLGLLSLAIFVWCLVHFTRALHGFGGYGRTFGALVLASVVFVIGMSSLLIFLGFGGPPADV